MAAKMAKAVVKKAKKVNVAKAVVKLEKAKAGAGATKKLRAGVAKKLKKATSEEAAKEAAKGPRAPSVPPCRGEKLNIGRFYAVAQCSLRMEAKVLMGKDFQLHDAEAQKLWPEFERMATRNLGNNEKWVPFHTVLGVHEFFLVQEVHHAKVSWWGDYERFVAMFIFRSHCKRELFTEVQMPFLTKKEFWKDLAAGFKAGCPMEAEIAKFRAKGNALQTSCFLIIPERILPDDDKNLIRNLVLRTQRLVKLAQDLYGVVNDKKTSSEAKFSTIKEKILATKNLGDTWVKMLTVVIDIARPELKLLQDRCEVGIGASDPLRKILEDEGLLSPKVKREQERRPDGAVNPDVYAAHVSIKQGIVAVKKKGIQLIQVTKSMAGSLDRAHFIAEKLAALANKGINVQEKLLPHRQKFFDDKGAKFPKLGLDEKQAELLKREKELGPRAPNPDEPTPSEALQQLRTRINQSNLPSAASFWKLLGQVEGHARTTFSQPIVRSQMKTVKNRLSAVTLQVQLCETRQFENFLAAKGAPKGGLGRKRKALEAPGEDA